MSQNLIFFWVLALLIKLILALFLPLTPDEAYYWVWSQHPQLSYFDHPPMVAWLFTIGRYLGSFEQICRWPAVILAHAGWLFWLPVLRNYLNPKQINMWFLVVLLMPLTGAGGLIVTPDLPLLFFWGFCIFATERLWQSGKTSWALALGAGLGLGFVSKYTMILFIPILFLWWRSLNKRPSLKTWLLPVIAGAILLSAPVWIWNWQNDFASFRFQINHGLGRTLWKPSWTFDYILVQIALISPVVVYYAVKAKKFLPWFWLAWFPVAFFLLTTFRGYSEANWPIAAHAAFAALAIGAIKSFYRPIYIMSAIWGLCLITVLSVAMQNPLPAFVAQTKLRDLHAYSELLPYITTHKPLFARTYQMAAKMSYDSGVPIYKLRGFNRRDFYDTLEESRPQSEKFYVFVKAGDLLPLEYRNLPQKIIPTVNSNYLLLEVGSP